MASPYSAPDPAPCTVVRARDDLVIMRVATNNQLAALLDAHWPGAKAVFADVESPIALELPDPLPDDGLAERLGEKTMATFCGKHGYAGVSHRRGARGPAASRADRPRLTRR